MSKKQFHIEYVDYDPSMCKEIYLNTEEEAFQYLVESEIDNIRDMDYDEDGPVFKRLVKIIRKGKGLKALLDTLNDWFKECHVHVYYKLTREDQFSYTYDHAFLIEQLDKAIADRDKRIAEWHAKNG
jgi:hypothetical protein